jgi:hypothetical protein
MMFKIGVYLDPRHLEMPPLVEHESTFCQSLHLLERWHVIALLVVTFATQDLQVSVRFVAAEWTVDWHEVIYLQIFLSPAILASAPISNEYSGPLIHSYVSGIPDEFLEFQLPFSLSHLWALIPPSAPFSVSCIVYPFLQQRVQQRRDASC